MTSKRSLKLSNQLSLAHRDDCKTKKDTKFYLTKKDLILTRKSPQTVGATINNENTAQERTATEVTGPNGWCMGLIKVRKVEKNQELIQSSTTPDTGYHKGCRISKVFNWDMPGKLENEGEVFLRD